MQINKKRNFRLSKNYLYVYYISVLPDININQMSYQNVLLHLLIMYSN